MHNILLLLACLVFSLAGAAHAATPAKPACVPGQLCFHGYPCTKDCSGHKAGYEWAERKGIIDPAQCKGRSNSFVEGCKARADQVGNSSISDQPPTDPNVPVKTR